MEKILNNGIVLKGSLAETYVEPKKKFIPKKSKEEKIKTSKDKETKLSREDQVLLNQFNQHN